MKAADLLHRVNTQARDAGVTVPRYGDDELQTLPPDDIRFIAALVIAAECWRGEEEAAPDRLAVEIAHARQVDLDGFAAEAARCARLALAPTHAELTRRRNAVAS